MGRVASKGRPNRLVSEKSPYLIQHAHNPVDWLPWGEEAFERARREDKPIFLSIGYSTCHWCHVMAHESFEDPETARLMNEVFVSVKVDREERPDLDSIYMAVCQEMTGGGGWPLTIVMTPERKPFFAGTYLPRESRGGMMGLGDLTIRVRDAWANRRAEVERTADGFMASLLVEERRKPGELGQGDLEAAYEQLSQRFDEARGGFGWAPKFPTPHNLLFLLRYWRGQGDARALHMVERTLESIRAGGIFDQVGFGIHRYSTDRRWLVPHFEKMLYDQALLSMAYLEAFQATGRQEFARVAREIFEYVDRDMTSPHGGFYSAEDADSEGVEGKFYVWSQSELKSILHREELELVSKVFGVTREGNFEGSNILHQTGDVKADPTEIESIRRKLLDIRSKRVRPHLDDKILTDWNALMIAALARAGRILSDGDYVARARRAMDFLLSKLRQPDGRLYHRYRDGERAIPGYLDDHAFLLFALLELYEASFDSCYLGIALEMRDHLMSHFWDLEAGAFHFTADDAEKMPIRRKEAYDGAITSGNSIAMLALLRLGRMVAEPDLEAKARLIAQHFAADIRAMPAGFTMMLSALDFDLGPSCELIIVGDSGEEDTQRLVRAAEGAYAPNKVMLLTTGDKEDPILSIADFLGRYESLGGKATAYLCSGYACKKPTADPGELQRLLAS